jgi:hypothetical protein
MTRLEHQGTDASQVIQNVAPPVVLKIIFSLLSGDDRQLSSPLSSLKIYQVYPLVKDEPSLASYQNETTAYPHPWYV